MAEKRVLIQAGHVAPREPGFESGTGTVREQELTFRLRAALVSILQGDPRFTPVPVPGDIPNGIKVDAALFLHGDGSANPKASGYSFGFPLHSSNARLAKLIGEEFEKIPGHPPHHTDNYTGGLRHYYGYSRVDTRGPEVLVEHGFLTNPREQSWLFSNIKTLAKAEYRALLRYFGYQEFFPSSAGWKPGIPIFFGLAPLLGVGRLEEKHYRLIAEVQRRERILADLRRP